jgi:hypothetical protein
LGLRMSYIRRIIDTLPLTLNLSLIKTKFLLKLMYP